MQQPLIVQNKKRLVLQFHITGRCNLRCKHCYRAEGDVEPLSYDDIKKVIEQFVDLLDEFKRVNQNKKRGHINITGGEPFIRDDIIKILELLGSYNRSFTYGVLSNGSFINEEMIGVLKATNVSFVQLSIDGDRKTHDYLRTQGDYDRVFSTAQTLVDNGIRTYISFTANTKNYKYIPIVAKECRKRKINKFWSDRMLPIGNGEDLEKLVITEKELLTYIRSLNKAKNPLFTKFTKDNSLVSMDRALQFLGDEQVFYTCSAGKNLLTVDEFGNIMPCRRLPLKCGDVFTTTLKEIYFQNEVFDSLRNCPIPKECLSCEYSAICEGGAKCQSFAAYGDYLRADPACPLKNKEK